MVKIISWDRLDNICNNCCKCDLSKTRNNVVVGSGDKNTKLLFVGEGPGRQEDLQGYPFVGRAGILFEKMLASIGMNRDEVYITNIVKCRPPSNRDPLKNEIEVCLDYLRCQVLLIKPKLIVCLGRIAAQTIIDSNFKITKQRGQWFNKNGYYLMATYHPAALLRDESKKYPAWEDFKSIKNKYDEIN